MELTESQKARVVGDRMLIIRDGAHKVQLVTEIAGIVGVELGMASSENASDSDQAIAMMGMIDAIVEPEDLAALKSFLRSHRPTIGGEELGEILSVVAEFYTERPTEPSSDSATGQAPTGTGSVDDSSPPPAGVSTMSG